MIALLPVVDAAPSFPTGKLRPQLNSQPPDKTSSTNLTRSEDLPKKPVPKPGSKVHKSLPTEVLSTVRRDLPEVKKQPAESLCMVPQAVICEQTPASPAVAEPLVLVEKSDAAEISETRLPVDQTEALVGANSPGAHELVEAIPDYSNNPLPEYPPLARQRQWQGVVWLLVDVSDEGLVKNLNVEQSCGHSVLDRAASRAVKNWHFTPARRAGIPTASQVRIPVHFRLEES